MSLILIVTDTWRPQVNGVVVSLEKTLDLLKAQGHTITLVEPGSFATMPMPLYPELRLALFPYAKVRRIFEDEKPDYIHIATEGLLGLAARKRCKRAGIPFTTSYHTHFPLYLEKFTGLSSRFAYPYFRWFHNGAARTMVSTESLRHDLESHGFRNLAVWPLGVDTSFFTPAVRPREGDARPTFAYLGRVSVEKNLEEFLRADVPGNKVVIGDGPDRARLERIYRSSAQFLGYRRGQDLVEALRKADVLVFPSRTDTFGLVILEALACGIPVAAHDVMGPRDIITEGVDGALSEDLARAATAAVGLSPEACRRKALTYSWERSAEAFFKNLEPAGKPV